MALHEQDPLLLAPEGLHTLAQVQAEDRPASRTAPERTPRREKADDARADMARMERYLQKLRQEEEGS